MDLTNASAIVTGGAGGFGSATVRRLAQKGTKALTVRATRSATSENAVKKLSEKGNEQRSDPVFTCIRSAKRTEKYGFGLRKATQWVRPRLFGRFPETVRKVSRACQSPRHKTAHRYVDEGFYTLR
jgi:hypothetical protein